MTSTVNSDQQAAAQVNPFPGPQAYTSADRHYFFGRTNEIERLTSLVLSSSLTLLYAPSGAGKSSLLQAGVAPHLEQEFGFAVLPVVHLGTGARANPAADQTNPFVSAVCAAVSDTDRAVPADIAAAAAARRPPGDDGQVLLILDQFEEVFNDRALWRKRDEFFKILTSTLAGNIWLRVIIALRSDYLAELVPHARDLPGQLVVRYQLEWLVEEQASEAVREAFGATRVELSEADLKTLMDLLLEDGPAEHRVRAQHVNTIQLQIICRRLWEELHGQEGPATPVLARTSAAGVRDAMMVRFVDEAIAEVVASSHGDEAAVRWWLRHRLITSTGQRAFVLVEDEQTAGLPNAVVRALAEVKLVQLEQRHGSRLAELTHDSMTEGVRRSNEIWLRSRYRKRRRWQALLLALLVGLLGFFPFLRAPGTEEEQIAFREGTFTTDEVRVPFDGVEHGVDVSLTISDTNRSVQLRVFREGANGTELGSREIPIHTPQTTDLVLLTSPGEKYVAVLTSANSSDAAGFSLAVRRLDMAPLDTDMPTPVPAGLVPVKLHPGHRTVLSVSNGYFLSAVLGVKLVAISHTRGWAVVEGSGARPIALLGVTPYSAGGELRPTVRRADLAEPTALTMGTPAPLHIDQVATVSFTVGNRPTRIWAEATCDRPVDLRPFDNESPGYTLNWSWTPDDHKFAIPLNLAPGQHRMLLGVSTNDGGFASCRVTFRPFDGPVLDAFGAQELSISPDANFAAYALALPGNALITARLPDALSLRLLCPDSSAEAGQAPAAITTTQDGSRFLAYLPVGISCTLWLNRTQPSDGNPLTFPVFTGEVSITGRGR